MYSYLALCIFYAYSRIRNYSPVKLLLYECIDCVVEYKSTVVLVLVVQELRTMVPGTVLLQESLDLGLRLGSGGGGRTPRLVLQRKQTHKILLENSLVEPYQAKHTSAVVWEYSCMF
jgi:hypothetical protein